MGGWMDGWMGEWIDGYMMDGWVNGWVDGWIFRWLVGRSVGQLVLWQTMVDKAKLTLVGRLADWLSCSATVHRVFNASFGYSFGLYQIKKLSIFFNLGNL